METDSKRLLVDCGLYQERALRHRNWDPFAFSPPDLDAVLLTHAHVDHCGLIPRLVREGFRGRIYCADPTDDIAKIILLDAARIQEEDAEFKRRRHEREGRRGPFPEVPLYTTADASATLDLFTPVAYGEAVELGDDVVASFHDAGHVLGSAMIKLRLGKKGARKTVIFSGDVGRWQMPILPDPSLFTETDYVVMESTYGDRVHQQSRDISDSLAEVINTTWQAGGNIIIPSFALQRAQEILYYLNELLTANRIPHVMVFLDSPMAAAVTEVFKRHLKLFDPDVAQQAAGHNSPFDFSGLKTVQTADESKAINHIKGTVIIIAGSGMCTGGRVKHHLVTNISRKESTILFVGYQAVGTLGRQIVDGAGKVRILGQNYPVRARVAQVHGFSAHADRDELFTWLSGLERAPKRVFVVHGEPEAARSFGRFVRKRTGWQVSMPEYGQQVPLD